MNLCLFCRLSYLFFLFTRLVFLGLRIQSGARNQLDPVERCVYRLIQKIKNSLSILKANLHLGGMYVHIDFFCRKLQIQNGKRKPMLHQIGAIALLQPFGKNIALQNTPVHEKDFTAAAGSRELGPSEKAVQHKGSVFGGSGDRNRGVRELPPVNAVNQFLDVAVSGGVELFLIVHAVMKGDVRVRQRKMVNKIRYGSCFCLGGL